MIMEWPQITVIVVWILGLVMHGANHGKLMEQKYNFFIKQIAVSIWVWLLYMGGFWT